MDNVSLQELLNEREWRRCFPDWNASSVEEKLEAFSYFCRTYWKIRHPDPHRGRILFELSDAQLEATECFLSERYSLFLKARQIGFSTLVSAFCFWRTYGYGDTFVAMLSKGQREAVKLLNKSKYGYRNLPLWMKHHGPVVTMTNEKMVFGNESEVESLPSGSDPARGESVTIAVIDEWAFLPNPDQAWASIEPIADVGGQVIALSTANGEGNIFHTQWAGSRGGGNGTNRFKGVFFPWWVAAAVERDQAWYDKKAEDLPDWQMAQEYPDNPEDAFLRSGRPVFNLQIIREWTFPNEPSKGYLHKAFGKIEFEEDGGNLSVWTAPEKKSVYVIGADVAEGLEHGDFSSAHVLDAKTNKVVAHWHGHVDIDVFGEDILPLLGRWYNNALIGVERNAIGTGTLKALQRHKYPAIFRDRTIQLRAPVPTETLGWYSTPQKKGLAIVELQKAMRPHKNDDGEVISPGLQTPDRETAQELKTFVREGNGKMHAVPPNHDDRVMSLAIAVQMLKYAFLPEYKVEEKPGPGTSAYVEEWLFGWERNQRPRIGAHSFRRAS